MAADVERFELAAGEVAVEWIIHRELPHQRVGRVQPMQMHFGRPNLPVLIARPHEVGVGEEDVLHRRKVLIERRWRI